MDISNNPLISVVVPVYNVEKYITRCIESILNQSYTNIEIILIDDGSLDGCSKICDSYKKKDKRIIVIHQENKGVAITRNVGIQNAKGAYISFVDSDDYVSSKYIEQLYITTVKSKKKISVCSYCRSIEELSNSVFNQFSVYNAHDAIKEVILERAFPPSPWGKLYSAELFENVRYPNLAIAEDYCTTPKLFHASCEIAYVNNPLYLYMINDASITNSKFNPNHLQYFDAANIVNSFLHHAYYDLLEVSLCRDVNVAMSYYIKMCHDSYKDEHHIKQVLNIIRRNYRLYIKSDYPLKKRIASICFAKFPQICSKFI